MLYECASPTARPAPLRGASSPPSSPLVVWGDNCPRRPRVHRGAPTALPPPPTKTKVGGGSIPPSSPPLVPLSLQLGLPPSFEYWLDDDDNPASPHVPTVIVIDFLPGEDRRKHLASGAFEVDVVSIAAATADAHRAIGGVVEAHAGGRIFRVNVHAFHEE